MKTLALFICFFTFMLFGFSPAQAESQNESSTTNNKSQSNDISAGKEQKIRPITAHYFKKHLQAAGIMLKFHNWPNKEEKGIILQYTKANNLKKVREISFFKGWVFEWVKKPKLPKNPKTLNDIFSSSSFIAIGICEGFPKLDSVKDCLTDLLLFPPWPLPGDENLEPNYSSQ